MLFVTLVMDDNFPTNQASVNQVVD